MESIIFRLGRPVVMDAGIKIYADQSVLNVVSRIVRKIIVLIVVYLLVLRLNVP